MKTRNYFMEILIFFVDLLYYQVLLWDEEKQRCSGILDLMKC